MHNLIFFGSDQYSAIVIKSLIESKKFAGITVVTDQAKPKDREQKVEPNPVEKLAIAHNLKIFYYQPNTDELSTIIDPDTIGLCASFDHLVPSEIIELFGGGLYNLHPSLLPQYRNVAPVQYALALGDTETGMTLFRISTAIDNGEIVGQAEVTIVAEDTTPSLSARLFKKGAELVLALIENKLPVFTSSATSPEKLIFTKRLTRDSGQVEWPVLQKLINNQSIAKEETKNLLLQLRLIRHPELVEGSLHDLVRALTPWPGVWTIAPTTKGDLRLSIESVLPEIFVKLAGKPKAISYPDFAKYYL